MQVGKMLTVGEAAEMLGLTASAIRAWIVKRRITFVRVGRCVRIPSSVVQELIERNTVPARETHNGNR
jgi:excisionase family DNA binding protein